METPERKKGEERGEKNYSSHDWTKRGIKFHAVSQCLLAKLNESGQKSGCKFQLLNTGVNKGT